MKQRAIPWAVGMLILFMGRPVFAFDHTDSNRVLVVYNAGFTADGDANGVQDSLQLMQHYVDFRGIPTNHVLAVTTGTGYYYSYHHTFYTELVLPIRAKLMELGTTNMDVLLLIYGIPYRTQGSSGNICVDNCLMNIERISSATNLYWLTNPYRETTPTFGTDKGHFDHATYKYGGSNMYLVCRLSAPNEPWGVVNQLEQIRYAEKYISTNQFMGTVYVDSRYNVNYTDESLSNDTDVISGSYSSYGAADKNMAYAEHYVIAKNLPLGWEKTANSIGRTGASILQATNAFLYGGWYNFGSYPDAFDWLPGSVGCDLNSDSAGGMRNGGAWVGGAFQQGLSCAAGVIGEPYLTGHQRPNVLIYYLLEGYTFAEAAALSTPSLFWQDVNLGDPLYAPFREKSVSEDLVWPILSTGFPQVVSTGQNSAVISFKIDRSDTEPEVVRCAVRYGTTPDCLQTNQSRKGYWVRNTVTVTGLMSGSNYYYYIMLTDLAGHSTQSLSGTFTTLNAPPTADFAADSWTGTAPFTVTFDGTASSDVDGSIVQWNWTFGDGQTGTGVVVEHTYTNYGYPTVDLTVVDDDGATATNYAPVLVYPASGTMRVFQDGWDGETNASDAYISCYSAEYSNRNYGAATEAQTYASSRRALVRFDLSSIPSNAAIEDARLRIFVTSKAYGNSNCYWGAYCITQAWMEGSSNGATDGPGVTWTDSDRGTPWSIPGGDFKSNYVGAINYNDIQAGRWLFLDVMEAVSNWTGGIEENNGWMLKAANYSPSVNFRTREWTDASQRPMLIVVYRLAEVQVLPSEHGHIAPSGSVQVVVGSNLELSVQADAFYYIAEIRTNDQHIAGSPFAAGTVSNLVFVWSNVQAAGQVSALFDAHVTTQGVPIWWLSECGWTGVYEQVAEEDQDGDGVITRHEYLADTHPTNGASFLRLTGMENGWLTWVGGSAVTQLVDRDDGSFTNWTTWATNAPPTFITNSLELPAGGPVGLYRLRVIR